MDDEELFPEHKLCGFLCAVLAVTSPRPCLPENLRLGVRCCVSCQGSDVVLASEDGVVLSPIGSERAMSSAGVSGRETEKCRASEGEFEADSVEIVEGSLKCRVIEENNGELRRRWMRKIGLVQGSMSVVHQILTLVAQKCLKVDARVVRAEFGGDAGVRALVLLDVYLPIALWSGWQFPKSRPIAGALFRHLSCDWEERRSIFVRGEYFKDAYLVNKNMWNLSDCHVLGCKTHDSIMDSSKKRLYELHEIFRCLPGVAERGSSDSSRLLPEDYCSESGIWDMSDDILINILTVLGPMDLLRVASTCRHLRSLAISIIPCMKLKLFPHQKAAVAWMLHREQNAELLTHPLYLPFRTEDGLSFHANVVSGEIVIGFPPTVRDFRGGMFCDEPGLGKTITALSLILKTQGTLADPPTGAQITWCMHNADQKCGYYELSRDYISGDNGNSILAKTDLGQSVERGMEDLSYSTPKKARLILPDEKITGIDNPCRVDRETTPTVSFSDQTVCMIRCTRSLSRIKKNLFPSYEGMPNISKGRKVGKSSTRMKDASIGPGNLSRAKRISFLNGRAGNCMVPANSTANQSKYNDNWVQCDACHKWRKLAEISIADASAAWFCSMNDDPLFRNCSVPEESWDSSQPITFLPGFYSKGTSGGEEQNVTFFTSVLKEYHALINSQAKKALTWLATLNPGKLLEMEAVGLRTPIVNSFVVPGADVPGYHQIFRAFGLIRKVKRDTIRWYYPSNLDNLAFDAAALRIALCEPLDSVRLYLSRATLIVVPSNLVDHWTTQIQKHVRPGQLRVYIWTDHKRPSAHCLAWDYDVIITTFNRLSAEWGPRKRSVLRQVHWLRVILDEGHTLGASLNLTNKSQMAVSLIASNRWILTGTPTPNTPGSQVSHLQPLLRFLHEEAYGQNRKAWENGIHRPFEAKMEEGRSRLLQLLSRCMISARKTDLQSIPPCIRRVTFLNFTEEHARSYNELVVTVRRNILMADWNDPSHVESLLNPKQWKFRSATIRNVRLSCCVAGHVKVTNAGEDIQETMDVLVNDGLDPTSQEYTSIRNNLLFGGNCYRCEEWCRLPVVTPCRHLLCLDCVALDSKKCTFPGCGNLYEMQTPETLARPENPYPKWPVPKDLIELQPSYKQDNWDPDWQSTSSSKVAYLVRRLKALNEANVEAASFKVGDDVTSYSGLLISHPSKDKSDVLPQEFDCSGTSSGTHETVYEKVLVFSQFLEHIHVIEQQLTISGIKFAGMYSPMHTSNKMKSLAAFQQDSSCMVLLMDGSAALGLDLSFVTHVFLMEPIWDRSMEEQVISRAHRMGATRPIHVETLVMRGTIEEQMIEFLQDADSRKRFLNEEFGKPDAEGTRGYRSLHDFAGSSYLSLLSFVRTNVKKQGIGC